MAGAGLRSALRRLCRAAGLADAGVPDADLLERFVAGRDEAAFELLLWRHGPMVLGVCERLLGNEADAEDAFQATFLALVRKAGSVGRGEAVGHWLYRVAYRAALKARALSARGPARGLPEREGASPGPEQGVVWRDLRPVLDEEVSRLPAKYRAPVVLCDLGEQTYEQAARQLGCPVGTLAVRLRRARHLLRERLTRRGVGLGVGVGGALWCAAEVSARVPGALAGSALRLAAGAAGGSARAAALAEGVVKAMGANKVRGAALAAVMALAVLGAGAVYCLEEGRGPAAEPAPPAKAEPVKVYSEVAGKVQVVAREARKGEKVRAGAGKGYVALHEGDRVLEGELLLRLEDRSARDEVVEKQVSLAAAESDLGAATKAKEEAERRFEALRQKRARSAAVSDEEFRGAKLTCERYAAEEKAKSARVLQARAELRKARTVLALHEVRCPVSGVIAALPKKPGDAVGRLEVVALIRPDGKGRRVPPDAAGPRSVDVRAATDGRLLAVATEIKPGEIVPPEKRVQVEFGLLAVEARPDEKVRPADTVVLVGLPRRYRRAWENEQFVPGRVVVVRHKLTLRKLGPGDRVEKGQLLALVNPAMALDDLAIKVAQFDAAAADLLASTKTKDEAQKRYESLKRQRMIALASVSDEDYRGARLAWDRYAQEEVAKRSALKKAQRELTAALTALKTYEVRSPVGGVVTRVLKGPGEAARRDEGVLRVRVEGKE